MGIVISREIYEMEDRGSKSDFSSVKEQRVYGYSITVVRCTLVIIKYD